MLWKEVREQAAILIALVVLGSGVISAATVLGSSDGSDAGVRDIRAYTNAGRLSLLSLAVAAGVVIGGTLFAGEKENGTLDCLEALPANRMRLWWGKLAAGVVMATVAGIALLAAGTLIGALGSGSKVGWLMWGMVLVYVAFGWGTFGSTITESTLAACAIGLLCAVVIGTPVFTVVISALRMAVGADWADYRRESLSALWFEVPPLVAMYAVAVFPLLLAGWTFTAPDRARQARSPVARASQPILRRPANTGFLSSLKALLWLTNRQWFVASLIGVGLMLATGVGSLHEDVHLMVVWPLATTLAGVFGGVLAWVDEQSKETFKFWGERRLPLGRLWAVKVATSFARTLGWTLLVFAPSLIRQLGPGREVPILSAAFRSGLLSAAGPSIVYYLLIWPLYGFAFGHLAGLLFRKTIVALGVGLLTAAPVAALWLPSLLTGGVHHWQLWPVPVLVLLTTRWILRAWSADRLASVKPLATVAAVGLACVSWVAFGLLYRAVEVPVVPEIDDDLAFIETVPLLDFEDGGRAFRQTTAALAAAFSGEAAPVPWRRPAEAELSTPSRSDLDQLIRDEWPEPALRAIGPWLTQPSLEQVTATLKDAANRPLGPLENPRGILLLNPPYRDAAELPAAVGMLVTRGLWKQLEGDSGEFAPCLDAALAATRNGRTMQPTEIYVWSLAVERTAFDAVDTWLTRLKGRPDLIRAVVAVLRKHEQLCPRDAKQVFLTERMIDRNRVNGISQWATRELDADISRFWRFQPNEATKSKANAETELLNFSLVVPWERERFRRVLGLNNASVPSTEFLDGSWLAEAFTPRYVGFGEAEIASQAHLAVSIAQLNLKLFDLEQGRPANLLDELVPRYWPAVPVDPFDGRPLRYRTSEGERIKMGIRAAALQPVRDALPPLPVPDEQRASLGGSVGGLAWLDRPVPIAPGIDADGNPVTDLDAVAAVAGGLVQAALEPLDEVELPAGAGGMPGRGNRVAAGTRSGATVTTWREVEKGQGVVWSVGPDRWDDSGQMMILDWGRSRPGRGDIVRVVPRNRGPR
ncbi:hypothetical protein PX52LOC_03972 [Limnoglobus roseus]|uniref:Uncharacterized protein n=2 Tax=Limnoglobus roseus TaxID=2598579 RepID=A0A5C1AG83_9BACT|nr:hypothetical protein PX52LOC_03972 [Limnoglobus roseus]